MRFITEEDLRQRFRRERFTEYEPEAGTRLTPGARQFLSDRGIRLTETDCRLLAETKTNVAHCIGSNTKAAKGVAPVAQLRSLE